MSDSQVWIERIVTFLVGGGAVRGAELMLRARKGKTDDFVVLKEAYREEFSRYKGEVDELHRKYTELSAKMGDLQDQNEKLKERMSLIKEAFPDLPIPMCLKDESGMMLSLNSAYEEAFLFPKKKTRADYIGFYDDKIWSPDVAEKFRQENITAISQKMVSFFMDDFGESVLKGWHFFNYPKYMDGVYVGVGEIAIPRSHDRVNMSFG